MANAGIVGNFKSFGDYQDAEEKNALAAALTMAKLQTVGSGGNLPAPLQLANEYQKRVAAGDQAGADLVLMFAKTLDKGMLLPAGPAGAVAPTPQTPPMATPPSPSLGSALGSAPTPSAPITNQAAKDATLELFGEGNTTGMNNAPPPAMVPTLQAANSVRTVPGYSQTAASMAAAKKGAEKQAEKSVELNMNPQIKRLENQQGEIGKAVGEAQGAIGNKSINAPAALSVLDQIESVDPKTGLSMLDRATGSDIGAAGARFNKFIGKSTDATKANADLSVLGNTLVNNIPRMQGPQSDKDVQFYKDQAGRIADPSVPAGDKRAAISAIRQLQMKYQEMGQDIFSGQSPINNPTPTSAPKPTSFADKEKAARDILTPAELAALKKKYKVK